ncbi:MAG: cobalamin biosynthesis protein, partial [Pseudomonadota bacterium]
MSTTLTVLAALLLDAWLGEPRRFHPLVGFGKLADYVEQHIYADSRWRGSMAALLLIAPLVLLTAWITLVPWHFIMDALLLYLVIGWNSLSDHARQVKDALLAGSLDTARQRVGYLVSRDTQQLDCIGITQGTI